MLSIKNTGVRGALAYRILLSCCWLYAGLSAPALANIIDLPLAVRQAIAADPWLSRNAAQQHSLQAQSDAATSLPNPELSLSVANVPSDGFHLNQEPMTQFKLGVKQAFNRGNSAHLRQQQLRQQAQQYPLQRQDRKARVRMTVSQLWLDAFVAAQSIQLIQRDKSTLQQLVETQQNQYAQTQGGLRQSDILAPQLELAQLEDQLLQAHSRFQVASGQLLQWQGLTALSLGETALSSEKSALSLEEAALSAEEIALSAQTTALADLPQQPLPATTLWQTLSAQGSQLDLAYSQSLLLNHPAILAIDQQIQAHHSEVAVAQEQFKPQWGVTGGFAYRPDDPVGNRRADLVSVGVTVDVPLFSRKRQEQDVLAAKRLAQSHQSHKRLLLQDMLLQAQSVYQRAQVLAQREAHYQQRILPALAEQLQAAQLAYTHDDGELQAILRIRLAALKAKLALQEIQGQLHKQLVHLQYFFSPELNNTEVHTRVQESQHVSH